MKQKHWQVSVFDKTSKTIRDDTFYTTDTEAYLVFELIDEGFEPDSAMVTVYNVYGKATINASVEVVDGIVQYEIPEEAIGHRGGWRTQVVFTKDNKDYTTAIIEFDVGGHLLDNKKPAIVDIENWNSFIKHAGELVDDWEQLEEIRQANETSRQTNELVREEAESNRQSEFEENELARESAESVRVANEEERELNEAERISKDSERDSKIEAVESQFQAVIENTTDKDVISAPEIIAARNGEANLKARLDKENQEVTAQLAETGNRIDSIIATPIDLPEIYVDEIHDARQGKSSVGENITEVKSKLAETDQRIDNIVTTPITEGRTTFLIHDETTNLIDKTTVLKDAYINGAVDGKEKNFVDTNPFYATDFIPIEPDTPYYHDSLYGGYFAFYDANKSYISGTGVADGSNMLTKPFTAPQNAYYIRVTIRKDSNLPLSWINKTNHRPADMRYKLANISFGDENLTQLEDIIANKNYLTEVKETDLTFLELTEGSNLIIQSEILYDSYIKGDDQGQVLDGSGLEATGYVELKPDTDYYFSDLYIGYYAFYDDNKVYITGSGLNGVGPLPALRNPFQIPSNAKYGRFTIGAKHDPANAWISTENATPPAEPKYQFKDNILVTAKNVVKDSDGVPTEYNGDDIAIFNHILAIGDSLTAGTFNVRSGQTNYVTHEQYAYPAYLQKMTGVSVTNKGHGGKTTKEWFDIYGSEDLSGYDCAIIQLGVNDLIRESTLGETKTYLTNIINKLKTENTGIKIFVSTIIPATSYSNAGYIDISEAIREVVASITSDVYLVDLAVYGHTKDEVAYNNGHLSAYGYWQLAKDYKSYISYIIANNKLAFRNVQFAGTDYTY